MTNLTDYLIKNSENAITLTLTEDSSAIGVSPTEISISLYKGYSSTRALEITRSPTGDGVAYSSGVVTITPVDLTEDLSTLIDGQLYRAVFLIKTSSQPDGVVFGGNDSANKIWLMVSTAPA